MLKPENTCVVLVDPENPRNIGFVARAMKCNGLSELRIVSTRFPSMHSGAYITGTSANNILDEAVFYNSLDEAIGDRVEAVAFSRRFFNVVNEEVALPELIPVLTPDVPTALVFGRESQGLNMEEVNQCTHLCAIPTEGSLSYNLGMAASISFYELMQKPQNFVDEQKENRKNSQRELPLLAEREAMFNFFKENSPEKDFNKATRPLVLRKIIDKMDLDRKELQMFFGMLRMLNKEGK